MTYELFYSDGGHGGPWPTYEAAKYAAVEICRGYWLPVTISIRERTKDGVGGYGATVGTVRRLREANVILHQRPGKPDETFLGVKYGDS